MSVGNSGEFNNYVLSKGPSMPSVPQNTPACSSFSDRMMIQMNLKNLKCSEGISLSEKDAVFRNLSNRLMALSSDPTKFDDDRKTLSRQEAMLELQRTRLGYLITHLERINLIESEREAELGAIESLQNKLINDSRVDLGSSGPSVEDGSIPDFWKKVLENVSLPCIGEDEIKLFGYVTNITSEYLPANIEGLKDCLAKICDECSKKSEWPTCENIPGAYGSGVRISFHLRPNNIIKCPANCLSIEIRYDIEVPTIVAHVVCSNFTRLEQSTIKTIKQDANNSEEDEISDLNLLDLMESFSKGIDISTIGEEGDVSDFYQEAVEQLSGFCDAIKARVIPYASQIYFNTLSDEE